PAEGHVPPIFCQEDRVAGTALDGSRPVHLPDGKISVPVKTDQHSTRAARVSDQEPQQWLAIDRVVRDSAGERRLPEEWRGLEEDPLLLVPEQGQRAKNQSDDE